PLEDVWNEAELENRYPEDAQGGGVFNGVPHAVLFAYTLAPVVLYNAEMFDELGIQVPEDRDMSVDQFLEIDEALDDSGVESVGVGGNTSYHLHHLDMGLLGGARTYA